MEDISSIVIQIANKHFDSYKIRNNQIVPSYCPFCGGGDNKDQDTFAVGLHNGAFMCHRGKCNKQGSFLDLCNLFGVKAPASAGMKIAPNAVQNKKLFDKPKEEDIFPLTDEIISYFDTRKISKETLEAFRIGSNADGNIVFPFYRKNVLTYVKYRKPAPYVKSKGSPKEWSMKNGEPILFGMDMVSFNSPLVITEGEIDAMCVYEAGYSNVVSVPCGCNNFEWVDICWDWIDQFQQIILLGDSDEPGVTMVNTLMRRLGEDRCMIPEEYPVFIKDGEEAGRICKDANEILYSYGKDVLKAIIERCEPAPIKGIINLASVPIIDPSRVPRVYTKIHSLDNALGGLTEGGLTIFTGQRGEGKSTITGTILLNALQQGRKVAAYSGELPPQRFLEWIMSQATEDKYVSYRTDEKSGINFPFVEENIQKRIRAWIDNKFFLFDNSIVNDGNETNAIIRMFTVCARRYGCTLFLVDNMMTALSSGGDDEYKAQAIFTNALKNFAVKYKVHIMLVSHPRKKKAGEKFENDDVSGSAVITNLADNVINVTKGMLQVTKNREFGRTPAIACAYNKINRRIYETQYGDKIVYGWNHEGLELPDFPASKLAEFKTDALEKTIYDCEEDSYKGM